MALSERFIALQERMAGHAARRPGARASRLGLVAIGTAVAGWSIANTIPKVVHLTAVGFAFYRLWLGAAVMAAVLLGARRRPTWRHIRASAPGGVLFGLTIALFVAALRRTGVADVLVIGALQPALTLLVAGRLFVSVLGASGNAVWSLWGDLLAAAALVLWTVYFLLSKRVREQVPATEYMTSVTVVASLTVTPIALLSRGGIGGLGHIRAVDWLLLAAFVAVAQGGHLMVAWAHAHVDVSVSTLFLLAEPAIGAVGALWILGEPLTWLQVVGGLIVIGSVGVVMRRATRAGSADVLTAEAAPG